MAKRQAGVLEQIREEAKHQLRGFPRELKHQLRGFGAEAAYQLGSGWGRAVVGQIFGKPKRRGR